MVLSSGFRCLAGFNSQLMVFNVGLGQETGG